MVDFNKLDLHKEIVRYLNSEADASEYTAYEGWSGFPNGRSLKAGNAYIISHFSNGKSMSESLWFCDSWKEESVDSKVRAIADELAPHSSDRWKLELPVLRALTQMGRKPSPYAMSARDIAKKFALSVPRAEYVIEVLRAEHELAEYEQLRKSFPKWEVPYYNGVIILPPGRRVKKTGSHRWEWRWKEGDCEYIAELEVKLGRVELWLHTYALPVTEDGFISLNEGSPIK